MKEEYRVKKVNILTESELNEYYAMELSLYNLIFDILPNDLKEKFINIRKSLFNNSDYYNFQIFKGENLCGYISFMKWKGELWLYDFTLKEEYKRSRILLFILEYFLNYSKFKDYNKIKFSVDSKNLISYKTWEHLGAVKISQDLKKPEYELTKCEIRKYLKPLDRKA